jgi:hypothetical protein
VIALAAGAAGAAADGTRTSGRLPTKNRSDSCSCSMHRGPIVSVSQPGAVHCVTIGMSAEYPSPPKL